MQYIRNICSRKCVNNVECTYTRVPGHIVDCSEFNWGVYSYIALPYVHRK